MPKLISMNDQVLIGAASLIGCRDSVKILMEYSRMQLANVPSPATKKAAMIPIFWFRGLGIFQMIGMGNAIITRSVMIVKMFVAASMSVSGSRRLQNSTHSKRKR